MDTVKVGSVVQLKSGGPYMTVLEISDDKLKCIWFTNNENEREGIFPRDVLVRK